MTGAQPGAEGPAPAPHAAWLLVAGLALAWNAAAGPHVFDAGELVEAGWRFGGSHPPGQPLHALVAKAATLVPLGPVPWRMAWVSAGAAVLCAWLAGRITGWLLEELEVRRGLLAELAPDAAALATLLSPPVLRQAGRVEVYGMALALTLVSVLGLLRWVRRGAGRAAGLRVAALAAGLAAAVHPPHALAAVAVGLGLCVAWRRDVLRRPRTLAWAAAACGLAVAAAHAYLPLRAQAGAPMWGEPATAAGLWDYLSARAYRQNLGSGESSAAAHLLGGARYAAVACGVIPIAGLVLLAWRRRERVVARAATLAAVLSLSATWIITIDPSIPDMVAYAGAPVALAIAAGAAGLVAALPGSRTAARALGAAALALLAANVPSLLRAPEAVRQDAPVLETLAGALVDTPPPRALVVVEGDFEAASWLMARAVDGARPDVAVFVPGLATSSWHWRRLAGHPLFDGRPVRGRGEDPRGAYLDGAVRTAAGRVAVAVGPMRVHGPGSVAGPYRILWPDATDRLPVWSSAIGERLDRTVAREARRGPRGDRGAVGAIVRHQQVARAQRLFVRGRVPDAMAEVRRAMHGLPESERALLEGVRAAPVRGMPPAVRSPGHFLTSPDDALRVAAAMLWAVGDDERARRLLELQARRGDAAAGLQLGWLWLAEGNLQAAEEAARVVAAEAPELSGEAAHLATATREASR